MSSHRMRYAALSRLEESRLVPVIDYKRCRHKGSKTVEGNNIRCNGCQRIVGFVEVPRRT